MLVTSNSQMRRLTSKQEESHDGLEVEWRKSVATGKGPTQRQLREGSERGT